MEGEIDKALNKDQSEQDLFQSAIGCTIDSAFEDMCQIKKIWHKEKGVQGFHLVQSFAPGEISPELAHQIGMEFADRLLGGKFQAVVSTAAMRQGAGYLAYGTLSPWKTGKSTAAMKKPM